MRARYLAAVLLAALFTATAPASEIRVEMDQQIDLGLSNPQSEGPAIYKLNATDSISFLSEDGDGFVRLKMAGNAWAYIYLDTVLAGLGPVDLSAAGSAIEFDCRYYQDEATNTNPYGDAPIFFRAYTYDVNTGGYDTGANLIGYKDWGIVYGVVRGNPDDPTWNDPPHPEWTHVVITKLDGPASQGDFQENAITRVRWYMTDWAGTGDDFVDIKNVVFRSGPGALPMEDLLLALKIAAGLETSYDFDVTKLDIDGNGRIDMADVAIWTKSSAEAPN